ncbi:MAG: hypothetical protein MUO21_10630 [Nitrososphaeraceae archaeon]|nr:hypothetical protein [Nitrososphaeraceae archaeon]
MSSYDDLREQLKAKKRSDKRYWIDNSKDSYTMEDIKKLEEYLEESINEEDKKWILNESREVVTLTYPDLEDLIPDVIHDNIARTYTEKEIAAFEKHLGERLPEKFREYMINVSAEVFMNLYPVVVNDMIPKIKECDKTMERILPIIHLGPKNATIDCNKKLICRLCDCDFNEPCQIKDFGIPGKLDKWVFGYKYLDKQVKEYKQSRSCKLCGKEDDLNTDTCDECNVYPYGGRIKIGDGGCLNEYYLIIKGPHKGEIFYGYDCVDLYVIQKHSNDFYN